MPRSFWTILGIFVLADVAVGLALVGWRARLARRARAEARRLFAAVAAHAPERAALGGLPAPVRRYLEVSGATRRAPVRCARMRHGGTFRPDPRRGWAAIRGVQYFAADPPGFVWWGSVPLAPGLHVQALDRSLDAEGRMLVRVAGAFTLGDVRGPEIDQGALLRLLAEGVWYPTAFLDARHVSWAGLDDTSARATLRVEGRAVEALFRFGPDGLPTAVEAHRFRADGGTFRALLWTGVYGDYREVDGLRVPFRCEVSWVVDGHPEPYARWELERIEYDVPEPF